MSTSLQEKLPLLPAPPREAPEREEPTGELQSPLRVVGLFAGIGGIELGLRRHGHETLEFCEIDASAIAVLKHHFPDVHIQQDVKQYEGPPAGAQLITAGFPCQDLSQAGKTLGLDGARSSLVGEVFAMARRHDTPWLLLENVPFLLRIGRGSAMGIILSSLERLGYNWAYRIVDTRAFGIPQRRKRVFILASKTHDPRRILLVDSREAPPEEFEPARRARGFYWTEGSRGLGWAVDAVPTLKGGSTVGIPSPPAIWLQDGSIIKPGIRDAERLQGFEPDWTQPAESVGRASLRWRLVGNAVTVNVAEWIGNRLRRPGPYTPGGDRPLVQGDTWPDAAYNVGEGRFSSWVSQYPVRKPQVALTDFLELAETQPLSERATAGFLARFEASTLSRPPGFLDAVRSHLAAMTAGSRSE